MKIIERNTHDTSRLVQMAPRKLRRRLAKERGEKLRPVYHHGIPVKEEHKAMIRALKVIDRKQAKQNADIQVK